MIIREANEGARVGGAVVVGSQIMTRCRHITEPLSASWHCVINKSHLCTPWKSALSTNQVVPNSGKSDICSRDRVVPVAYLARGPFCNWWITYRCTSTQPYLRLTIYCSFIFNSYFPKKMVNYHQSYFFQLRGSFNICRLMKHDNCLLSCVFSLGK